MDIKDRVLVVEDDKSIRNFFRTILEANNYDVIMANTGAEAYSMVTSQCPDLVILDLKEMDSERHRILTGHGNENILQMAKTLSDMGKDMWIRHVLVPGVTDSRESLLALRDFLGTLETVRRAEILPYHTMGQIKWEQMGLPYALDGVRPPSEEEVRRAEELTGMRA